MPNKKERVKFMDSQDEQVPKCMYWSAEEVADFIDGIGFSDYRVSESMISHARLTFP